MTDDEAQTRAAQVRSWRKRFALGALCGVVFLYTLRGMRLGVFHTTGASYWALVGLDAPEAFFRETLQRNLLITASALLALGAPWWRHADEDGPAPHPYALTFAATLGGLASVCGLPLLLCCGALAVDPLSPLLDGWISEAAWPLHLLAYIVGGCLALGRAGRRERAVPSLLARAAWLALPVTLALAGVIALGTTRHVADARDLTARHATMQRVFGPSYTAARARVLTDPWVQTFYGDDLQVHTHDQYLSTRARVSALAHLLDDRDGQFERVTYVFHVSGARRQGMCLISARWKGGALTPYSGADRYIIPERLIRCLDRFRPAPRYYMAPHPEHVELDWQVHLKPPSEDPSSYRVREGERWALAFDVDVEGGMSAPKLIVERGMRALEIDALLPILHDGYSFPVVGGLPRSFQVQVKGDRRLWPHWLPGEAAPTYR